MWIHVCRSNPLSIIIGMEGIAYGSFRAELGFGVGVFNQDLSKMSLVFCSMVIASELF